MKKIQISTHIKSENPPQRAMVSRVPTASVSTVGASLGEACGRTDRQLGEREQRRDLAAQAHDLVGVERVAGGAGVTALVLALLQPQQFSGALCLRFLNKSWCIWTVELLACILPMMVVQLLLGLLNSLKASRCLCE